MVNISNCKAVRIWEMSTAQDTTKTAAKRIARHATTFIWKQMSHQGEWRVPQPVNVGTKSGPSVVLRSALVRAQEAAASVSPSTNVGKCSPTPLHPRYPSCARTCILTPQHILARRISAMSRQKETRFKRIQKLRESKVRMSAYSYSVSDHRMFIPTKYTKRHFVECSTRWIRKEKVGPPTCPLLSPSCDRQNHRKRHKERPYCVLLCHRWGRH